MKKIFSLLVVGMVFYSISNAQTPTPITSDNFNNYSPTLTGIGASGTWDININGSAINWGGKSVNYSNFHGPLDVNGLLGTNTSFPGVVTAFSSTAVKGWLNESLQSITDRENKTTNVLFITGQGAPSGVPSGKATYLQQATAAGYGTLESYDFGANSGNSLAINPNGGNVGIGTTTPFYKLDVNGTGKFGEYAIIGTNINQGFYQDASNGAYRSRNTGANGFYFQSYAGALTSMFVGLDGSYAGRVELVLPYLKANLQ